ncbi:MAG: iron ABC transporter permease [Geminicoccaceae bacterium]|nr:MAG: iron ABC transporter permease [Geminicoccaceae bacterium]
MRLPLRGESLVLAPLVVAVGILCLWPMLRLLVEAVAPGGAFDLALAERVLQRRATWNATLNSLDVAFWSALFSLVLGTAFAILVGATDVRASTALVFGFVLPLLIPPPITALSWTQLTGPGSPLLNALGIAPPPGTPNPLYSREGLILLMGVQHAPLVFLTVRAALVRLPGELVESAYVMGDDRMRALRRIVLPLLAPAMIAGTALAFVSSIGNFGIAAFIGIPAGVTLLPVLIFQRLASFGPQVIGEVAVLSVLVGSIAFTGVLLQTWLLRRQDVAAAETIGRPYHLPLGRARPWVELAAWLIVLGLLVLPLIALVTSSLVPAYGVRLTLQTITFANYEEILLRQAVTQRAFVNSTLLATAAAFTLMLLALPLGYFLTWRKSRIAGLLRPIIELPYALPGVVLAVACILIFIRPLPFFGVSLYGTLWIIFLAYLARFLTLALTPVIAGYQQIDRSIDEAAQLDGAGLAKRLRTVTLPLLMAPTAAGGLLVFLTSFNELTVSALLWSRGSETLGVLIFNLQDGGSGVLAAALAVLCLLAVLAIVLALHVLDRRYRMGVLPWSREG